MFLIKKMRQALEYCTEWGVFYGKMPRYAGGNVDR